MRISKKYPIILNGIGAIALLAACLGLIAVFVRFGGSLGSWFATHTDLTRVAATHLGITGLIVGIPSYLWQKQLVPDRTIESHGSRNLGPVYCFVTRSALTSFDARDREYD